MSRCLPFSPPAWCSSSYRGSAPVTLRLFCLCPLYALFAKCEDAIGGTETQTRRRKECISTILARLHFAKCDPTRFPLTARILNHFTTFPSALRTLLHSWRDVEKVTSLSTVCHWAGTVACISYAGILSLCTRPSQIHRLCIGCISLQHARCRRHSAAIPWEPIGHKSARYAATL